MVIYKCDICNKIFKQKSHLTDHKNRKKPCKIIEPNRAIIEPNEPNEKDTNDTNIPENSVKLEPKIKCVYCNKQFVYKNSLIKHLNNRCKIKRNLDFQKEEIFNDLLNKINNLEHSNNELRKEIEKLAGNKQRNIIKKSHINSHNKTKNTINGNINNTFVLVGCGKEDIGKIDKTEILRALKCGFHAPIKLTDAVHFNPNYPEYHNVYISNMKDKYGMVYDGNNWNIVTKNELVDKLYDTNKSYVEENLEEFYETLVPSQRNALDRWLNMDDDTPKIKDVKERIKLLLYNKRGIAIQTKDVAINK